MTDTPIEYPNSKLDLAKAFIGDLARPAAIFMTSAATSVAIVRIAFTTHDWAESSIFVGALFAGLGGLSAAKTMENIQKTRANADIAKAANSGS